LSEHRLGNQGVSALAESLRRNVWLKDLKLRNVDLGKEGFLSLAAELKGNSNLELLDISHNDGLESDGFKAFGRSLPSMSQLKEFQFRGRNTEAKERMKACVPLLVSGLKGTYTLHRMSYGNSDTLARFYLDLNRMGRRYLYDDVISLPVWADILARMTTQPNHAGLLFFFLRHKADLLCISKLISRRKRKRAEVKINDGFGRVTAIND
jgi:hypothetical protein